MFYLNVKVYLCYKVLYWLNEWSKYLKETGNDNPVTSKLYIDLAHLCFPAIQEIYF